MRSVEKQSLDVKLRRYLAALKVELDHREVEPPLIERTLLYAERLLRGGLPVIFDQNHLSKLVGYQAFYLYQVAENPGRHYRRFSVPKKSGGSREIAEPLPSLKEIQRWILDNIVQKMKVNPAAKAYMPGSSVKGNARFHRGQEKILVIDIKDFFPSIKAGRVFSQFQSAGYSKHVSAALTDLCCLDGSLPQGAPTSAALSNVVMRPFDNKVLAFCRSKSIRYTRYADDLVFSGDFNTAEMIAYVYRSLFQYGFKPNFDKTRVMRSHQRQLVTGVVVNDFLQISREKRRTLRQAAHFIEKYGIEQHMQHLGLTKARYIQHLFGQAGFAAFINPNDRDAARLKQVLSSVLANEFQRVSSSLLAKPISSD